MDFGFVFFMMIVGFLMGLSAMYYSMNMVGKDEYNEEVRKVEVYDWKDKLANEK